MLATSDRELERLRRPRRVLHDADEEVRREERPEQHRLGDDEEQHAEQLRVDARALVRLRRPWCSAWASCGDRRRTPSAPLPPPAGSRSASGSNTTCSTGRPVARAGLVDQVAAQPARLVAAAASRSRSRPRDGVSSALRMLVRGSGCVDVAGHVEAGLAQLARASGRAAPASAAPVVAAALRERSR